MADARVLSAQAMKAVEDAVDAAGDMQAVIQEWQHLIAQRKKLDEEIEREKKAAREEPARGGKPGAKYTQEEFDQIRLTVTKEMYTGRTKEEYAEQVKAKINNQLKEKVAAPKAAMEKEFANLEAKDAEITRQEHRAKKLWDDMHGCIMKCAPTDVKERLKSEIGDDGPSETDDGGASMSASEHHADAEGTKPPPAPAAPPPAARRLTLEDDDDDAGRGGTPPAAAVAEKRPGTPVGKQPKLPKTASH